MEKEKTKKYQIEDGEHKGEVIVSWIITHACQEKCKYCISPVKGNEIMSESEHFAIQNQLISTGLTKNRYIGGEPLIVPHIHNLVRDAHEKGVDTRISTNGILLTKEKLLQLKDYLNSIAFPPLHSVPSVSVITAATKYWVSKLFILLLK